MKFFAFVDAGVRALKCAAAAALAVTLVACSSGATTEENPPTTPPVTGNYNGPPAANADVQAFKVELWDHIYASNRCGGCHNQGGQSPTFARNDDINLAYQAANTIVNFSAPDQSRIVTKVASGHNCWVSDPQVCADTMLEWVTNWIGGTTGGGTDIELETPPENEVGGGKQFPAGSGEFQTLIWTPILRPFCAQCHSSSAVTPQAPFFASADPDEAYAAAKSKINLDTPAQSRFVVRLREEFHNCWSGDCADDANEMEAAITAFAEPLTPTEVSEDLILSRALTLYEGTVASGGNRIETAQIAKYEFKTGEGTTAFDTSGVEPAADLMLTGDVTWVGGWGIDIKEGGKAQGTSAASAKLSNMIKSTGEFTFEAWAAPANVMQENAYIVSYSGGNDVRNATLGQQMFQYEALVRHDETDENGAPALLTNADDQDAQASLQHLVLTYDPVNGRRIYVNGAFTGDEDEQGTGSLDDWDDTFALVLGNETSNERQWEGVLRFVAIHNRALTQEQVEQNFAAGVGERYFLLFNISHLLPELPQSYVMLEASQFDSYGYLFQKPTFISLNPNVDPNFDLSGIRIGVNGAEAKSGQTFARLGATVAAPSYTPENGQLLGSGGAVIALEKGPMEDLFFLSFERIAGVTHPFEEPPVPPPAAPADAPAQAEVGVRTFDEINATMAAITGVSPTTASVAQTYAEVQQALPTVESIETFLASHQTAVAQLAIEYCDVLVNNNGLRTAFFPGLDVNQTAGTYFAAQANKDLVIDPLIAKAVGVGIATQPEAAVRTELNAMIDGLIAGAAGSQAGRTATVTKAACAAVLGSGTTLLQ